MCKSFSTFHVFRENCLLNSPVKKPSHTSLCPLILLILLFFFF